MLFPVQILEPVQICTISWTYVLQWSRANQASFSSTSTRLRNGLFASFEIKKTATYLKIKFSCATGASSSRIRGCARLRSSHWWITADARTNHQSSQSTSWTSSSRTKPRRASPRRRDRLNLMSKTRHNQWQAMETKWSESSRGLQWTL